MTAEYDEYRIAKAKAYANCIRSKRKSAYTLQLCLADIRESMDGLGAMRYDRENVQGGGMDHGDDAIAVRQAELDEATESYKAERAEWIAMLEEFNESVSALPVPERDLLLLRYGHAYEWRIVADAIGYSEDHCRGYMKAKALLMLYDAMPHRWRDPSPSAI